MSPYSDLPHPAPAGTTIYHWQGGLLLLARTLVLTRPTMPISATLRLAISKPYTVEVEDCSLETRASLVGSKRLRKRIVAVDSDMALFYFPIEWPEYAGLRKALDAKAMLELDIARFAPVMDRLQDAFSGRLTGAQVRELSRDTLALVVDAEEPYDPLDPRIRRACEILATTPLDAFTPQRIAEQVALSPSRLRALFKQQVGHSIGEYARWSAVWQAMGHWRPERTFGEAAATAGFYDLAHGDKAFTEVFGMSPSLATNPQFVNLIRCA